MAPGPVSGRARPRPGRPAGCPRGLGLLCPHPKLLPTDHPRGQGDREDQGGREHRHGRTPPCPQPEPLAAARRLVVDPFAAQPALQVLGQRLGRGVAPGRLLLQALQADRLQVAVDPRVEPRGRLGRPRPGPARASPATGRAWNGGRPVSSSYRIAPRPYTSAAVVIGRSPARACSGAMYARRAHHRPGRRQLAAGLDPLGQPEVGHVRPALARRAGCSTASGPGAGCPAGGRGARPGRPSPAARRPPAGRRRSGRAARRGCRPRSASW